MDVALLVEARRQLDQHGDLLVALGGALQRRDDRRADAGAVQRLLDRQHVGVVGGLRDQRDHRVVGLVRVVQQDVALVEHREEVAVLLLGQRRSAGCSGGSRSASKPGQVGQAEQHPQIERPGHGVDVVRRRCRAGRGAAPSSSSDADASTSSRTTSLRRRRRTSRSTSFEVRAAAFVVELELGVARQTDDRRLEDRLAGKQLRRAGRG